MLSTSANSKVRKRLFFLFATPLFFLLVKLFLPSFFGQFQAVETLRFLLATVLFFLLAEAFFLISVREPNDIENKDGDPENSIRFFQPAEHYKKGKHNEEEEDGEKALFFFAKLFVAVREPDASDDIENKDKSPQSGVCFYQPTEYYKKGRQEEEEHEEERDNKTASPLT